jgi:hypothetical protein
MLYVMLIGSMIVLYMAMGLRLTLGVLVGGVLGVWSQHSELAEKIISTITAQVAKDLSTLI